MGIVRTGFRRINENITTASKQLINGDQGQVRPVVQSPSVPSLTTFPGNGVTPNQGKPSTPVLSFPHRKQRRPGPASPNYAIPRDQWPDVLRRVDQGESYRQIAQAYHTSYQSIYRIIRAARKLKGGE